MKRQQPADAFRSKTEPTISKAQRRYTNLENKLIIWMCLVEQIDKGMDTLV